MIILFLSAFLVVFVSGFVALFESAIVYTDEVKLQYVLQKSQAKERTSKTLKNIINNKDKYLSSLAIVGTMTNILGSSIIGALAAKTLSGTSLTIFVGTMLYFMLVFSKILPKVIAVSKYDVILLNFFWIIRIAKLLTSPLLIFTLFWFKVFKPENKRMSVKELQLIINHFAKHESLTQTEGRMLDNILSLKKKTVEDILNNKNHELIILNSKRKIKKYRQKLVETKTKRYLVEKDGKIIGIAFYRDIANKLLERVGNENTLPQPKVGDCLKEAIIIKSNADLLTAMTLFKESKEQYAIVVNNYNKEIGIITAKQLYTYSLNY